MTRNRTTRKAGFSLIEVIAAIAILSLVIPTVYMLLEYNYVLTQGGEFQGENIDGSRQVLEAQLDVSNKVEELMASGITKEILEKVTQTAPSYTEEEDNVTVTFLNPEDLAQDADPLYYEIEVTSEKSNIVFADTTIRNEARYQTASPSPSPTEPGGGGE